MKGLPLPERFGTYALVLVRGNNDRRFLATACRVPRPVEGGTVLGTPIFGEGQMLDRVEQYDEPVYTNARMGIRGWRSESGGPRTRRATTTGPAPTRLFNAAEKAGCKIMVTLGGTPQWPRPFKEPTPARRWDTETGGIGQATGCGIRSFTPLRQVDHRLRPALLEGRARAGCGASRTTTSRGKGAASAGWARDMLEYREDAEGDRRIRPSRRSPTSRCCAASSIMNTEDKLYPDGTNEFDKYIDVFTDHYVTPSMCYGPMVAKAHGKSSDGDRNVVREQRVPAATGRCPVPGRGQGRLSPWHPRVLFDPLPGTEDRYFIPTPVVTATAAFNTFVTARRFEQHRLSEITCRGSSSSARTTTKTRC